MIFIIIPVYNRINLTQGCLESLKQQTYRDFNVILVDDGSTDGTSEMVRTMYPDTILLKGDGNLWWAGSVNKGIRYALSVCQPEDYILTLNDDLIVPPEYLTSLIEVAIKTPNCIIGSVESTMDDPEIIKSGGIICNWVTAKESVLNNGKGLDEFPPNFITEVSILTGRGSLYPIKVFREVGFFDDQHIIQCADTELPIRANLQFGYRLIVCYDAVVFSYIDEKENINSKEFYSLSDINEYFFDLRSHFNLKTRYWIARNIAPNNVFFLRYLSFNILRTTGHFVIRLNFLRLNSKKKQDI